MGSEYWVQKQCTTIEVNLFRNYSKWTFQVMKISQYRGSQESTQSKTSKESFSLKSKRLLVGGQNTAQNFTTTRSTETPAFLIARNQ